MNIDSWREQKTRAFSCEYNPNDRSDDNGPLFTSHAYRLGLIDSADYEQVIAQYIKINGFGDKSYGAINRYPDSPDYCSWDDHVAVACSHIFFAKVIYNYMERSNWRTPDDKKLWRFPIVIPAIRAAAGYKLNIFRVLQASLVFIFNMFEKKEETSGKLVLWHAASVLWWKHWILRGVIRMWIRRMKKVYGDNWLNAVLTRYFPNKNGETHPFVEQTKFN